MFVNAGELNKRIEIFEKVPNRNENGYGKPDEAPVLSCWAKYTQTSGTELVRANSDFGEVNVRFLIRWPSVPVDRKMYVRYRGEAFEIVYINGYGDSREYLEIWCKWTGRGGGP